MPMTSQHKIANNIMLCIKQEISEQLRRAQRFEISNWNVADYRWHINAKTLADFTYLQAVQLGVSKPFDALNGIPIEIDETMANFDLELRKVTLSQQRSL